MGDFVLLIPPRDMGILFHVNRNAPRDRQTHHKLWSLNTFNWSEFKNVRNFKFLLSHSGQHSLLLLQIIYTDLTFGPTQKSIFNQINFSFRFFLKCEIRIWFLMFFPYCLYPQFEHNTHTHTMQWRWNQLCTRSKTCGAKIGGGSWKYTCQVVHSGFSPTYMFVYVVIVL